MIGNRDTDAYRSSAALRSFRAALEEAGIDVTRLERGDPTRLEYSIADDSGDAALEKMGWVMRGFVRAQNAPDELGDLEATLRGGNDDTATWRIKSEWVAKYQRDEWSNTDLAEAVKTTFEVG